MLERTLASFRASDWDWDPILQTDDAPPATPVASRLNANWLRALDLVATGPTPLALVLEDDVEVNAHLHHNLERWAPLVDAGAGPFFGTLYNAARTTNPHAMWGSQALIVSRDVAAYVVKYWDEEDHLCDTRIPRLASRITTVHVHAPSLVQHVGAASTWGGTFHQAHDFDRTWRAA
jgi:hypothetical protein